LKSLSINSFVQIASRFPYGGRMIRTFQGFKPTISKSCVIEETGRVIGDVVFGEHCSL